MFLFFVWFIFWYLDRENAFPKIMLKLWSLCFHADVLSVLILNRRSFQFFSARNVSSKDMLGNHSVKHAWKSVFIISGVTFFFFFSVPSMRLSRCISILCSCAYSRTRANLVCDHVQALLIDMLICSVCTVRVSELLKTSQIVISISADSRESLDLMLYCVTGIFSFKRASYYIIVCNWDKLSQWSRDNAPTYAQFTLQVSVDAMSSAFVTTSMCSVSGL